MPRVKETPIKKEPEFQTVDWTLAVATESDMMDRYLNNRKRRATAQGSESRSLSLSLSLSGGHEEVNEWVHGLHRSTATEAHLRFKFI